MLFSPLNLKVFRRIHLIMKVVIFKGDDYHIKLRIEAWNPLMSI